MTSFVIEGRAAKGGGKLGFVYRAAHYVEACRTDSLVSIVFRKNSIVSMWRYQLTYLIKLHEVMVKVTYAHLKQINGKCY